MQRLPISGFRDGADDLRRSQAADSRLPPGNRDLRQTLDGLQRTHTATTAAIALAARARGEPAEDFVEDEIASMEKLKQKPLSLDEFLARPFIYQEWRDLKPEELVRLFIVLNAGQQKVSPRHLLEVIGRYIREMFESWGLQLLTERQEKETPRRRGRRMTMFAKIGLLVVNDLTAIDAVLQH
jgi:hypothetical protein